jgi:hypothetical protein
MPKPTVQRVTDIASRTAVVQPLQPKKSRKNIGKQNSIRGFFAGVVRKKLRLNLSSKKVNADRIYRISGAGGARTGVARRSSRRAT